MKTTYLPAEEQSACITKKQVSENSADHNLDANF